MSGFGPEDSGFNSWRGHRIMKFLKFSLSIIPLALLFFSLIPIQVSAAGLVPCGGKLEPPCQLCHIFVLTNNIIFGLIYRVLVPGIAVFLFILGGLYLLTAAGKPEGFNKAKNILTATVIGLVIIFLALVLVNVILDALGVVEWTGLKGNWLSPDFWYTTCT